MTEEQYKSLNEEQKNQIKESYNELGNGNGVKSQEITTNGNENLKQQEQSENSKEITNGSDEGLQKELSVLSEEVGNKISIENGELIIEGLKNEKGENFKLNLYNEKGELKNKTELELEISKFYSRTIASISNNNTKMSEEQEKSNGVLSKVWNWLIPTAHAPYDEGNKKETNQYANNPNYGNYNETIKYYEDKGINYDFTINTNSEFYDEDKAIIKQDNIINILGNKDLLHEVKLYPNGEEYKKDEKGNILKDKDGKFIKNESITMYQVREEGDNGGIYDEKDYKRDYKGQCTYFVSKILENGYPDAKLYGKNAFGMTRGVKTLIENVEKIVDSEGKQLFEKSNIPSIGSIYLNPNEEKTNGNGHTALVINVKLIKKGKIEEEDEYEITLLEQNSTIEKNGVQYEPLDNFGGKEYGEKKDNNLDYTMVVGQKIIKVTGKNGITYIQKK